MKYGQGSVGLGILSWRGHKSLEQSLNSYAKEDFFDLFDDCMAFLPDPDENVQKVVRKFPVRAESDSENKGIMAGMEEIAQRLKTDYIFFVENDCPLLESKAEAHRQIKKALNLLHTNQACVARMRHVKQFGEAFETIKKYNRYFPNPDTNSAKLKRLFRPSKARRISGTAIYGETSPDKKFPDRIRNAGDGFYLVDTSVLPWTNQSIMISRAFFLDTIIPFCHSVPLGRTANGFRTLEIELNRSNFWTKSGWKIACGLGLLTHNRVNDRGY